MSRTYRRSLAIGWIGFAGLLSSVPAEAAPRRAEPDQAAMREAMGLAATPDRYISSRAVSHYLHAGLARERGDADRLLTELKLAALYESQNPAPKRALAAEWLRRGEFDRAEAVLDEALQIDPKHAPSVRLRARIDLARGRVRGALVHLRRAIRLDPRSEEAFALLAEAELARGDVTSATAAADRLVETARELRDETGVPRPNTVRALLPVASAASSLQRFDQAERLLRAAVELSDAAPEPLTALVDFLETHGRPHEAAQALSNEAGELPDRLARVARLWVLAGEPLRARAYADAALVRAQQSRSVPDEALEAFVQLARVLGPEDPDSERVLAQVTAWAPSHPRAWLLLARSREARGRFDEAADAYAKVPETDPLAAEARAKLAWCRHRLGASEQALSDLRALLDAHPAEPEVAVGLASVLAERGAWQEALSVLDRVPMSRPLAHARARLHVQLGQPGEALRALGDVPPALDEPVDLALMRWRALAEAGRTDEALAQMRARLQRRIETGVVRGAVSLLVAQDQAAEAERLAWEAAERSPAALPILGELLLDRGRPLEAAEVLSRAVTQRPEDTGAWTALVRARCDLGDRRQAARASAEVRRLTGRASTGCASP